VGLFKEKTMPGIARVGTDTAGGMQLGGGNTTVFVNGAPAQVLGGPVAGHGLPPHSSPIMVGASSTVFAQGIPVCRQGDSASCGHTSTGSGNVFAG
tara:strand:+ start:2126 stop:2413 length:288 start_codon:yes stop_codon:yes gene_type:complete